MKKLNLSRFDLGIIIAFAVIALIGGGVWWYLSGALQNAQSDDAAAKADFDKYSSNAKYNVVVSNQNGKTIQGNIDVLRAQLDPLIQTNLLPKENKLSSISREDPVAWKQDLDDAVNRLSHAAQAHQVTLPANFYFGFSRYSTQNPRDEQTTVLSKQLMGIEQISTILINAPVSGIQMIRRTYEEDPHSDSGNSPGADLDSDRLGGYALSAPGNVYTAYPFEIEFEASPENFRTVLDNLMQSPYVFIVRAVSVENSNPNSPRLTDLDKIAETPDSSVVSSAPGEVANTTSTKGPQKFFGYSTLKIKARIDMIEWHADVSAGQPNKQNSLQPR